MPCWRRGSSRPVTHYQHSSKKLPLPAAPQARVQLGIALARAGNHTQAARELAAVAGASDAPWLPERTHGAGGGADPGGNPQAAVTTYLRVADEHADSPAAPEALFWAADSALRAGQLRELPRSCTNGSSPGIPAAIYG